MPRTLVIALCGALAAVAAAGATAAVPRPVTFAAKSISNYGSNILTLADMNGDGKLDEVQASAGAYYLPGGGDGTFTSLGGGGIGAGQNDYGIAAADFNGDGKLDLALASSSANTVTVGLDGPSGFGAASYATGSQPHGLAAGDLNGDGRPDLAVANITSGSVSVLLNKGDGSFADRVDYPGPQSASAVAIGDVTGDGRPDLVVGGDGSMWLLPGNGNGTFGSPAVYSIPGSPWDVVTLADVNGDGRPDVVVSEYGSLTVSVLLAKPDGTIGSRTDLHTGTYPASLAVADLNGDGKPDIVAGNDADSDLSVFLGNGDGTFAAPATVQTGNDRVYGMAVGDVNGDGRPDVVVTSPFGTTVLLNTTAGSNWSSETDVSATVKPTLSLVRAPAALAFPSLAQGESSGKVNAPLVVQTNDAFGYQLTVSRTVFSAGDIPLSVIVETGGGGEPASTSKRQVPAGKPLTLGSRSGTPTSGAGDVWKTTWELGPVPHVSAGSHTATLTFTVVGL